MTDRTMGVKALGIVAAVISLATAIGVVVWAQEKMTNDATASIKQATIVLAEQVDLSFSSLNRSLRFFEQSLRDRDLIEHPSFGDVRKLVELAGDQPPAIDSLSVLDPDGFIETNSRRSIVPYTSLAKREYFVELKENRVVTSSRMYVGAPFIGILSGKVLIPVARRLVNKDAKFQGVLVGYLDHKYFDEMFGRVYRPATGEIALERKDGIELARFPRESEIKGDVVAFTEQIPAFDLIVGMRVEMETLREPWRPILSMVVLSSLLTSVLILVLTTYATRRILQEQDWSGIKRKAGQLMLLRGGKDDE